MKKKSNHVDLSIEMTNINQTNNINILLLTEKRFISVVNRSNN